MLDSSTARQNSTDLDRPRRTGAWSQPRLASTAGKALTATRQRPRQRLDGASTARQLDSQGSKRERPQERKSGPGASCAHVPATGVVGSSGAVLAEQELPRLARCAHRPPRKFLIRNCPRPRPPGPARRGAGKGAGLRLFNSPVLSVLSINISVISVNHTRNADR